MQESDTKLYFGKLLGEIYRLQKQVGLPVDDRDVFGLCEGVEEVIDSALAGRRLLTRDQSNHVAEILTQFQDDESKLAELKGYYQIRKQFEERGVDQYAVMKTFRYFLRCEAFTEVIEKICLGDSPTEFKQCLKL
jgi:hypothetical protein